MLIVNFFAIVEILISNKMGRNMYFFFLFLFIQLVSSFRDFSREKLPFDNFLAALYKSEMGVRTHNSFDVWWESFPSRTYYKVLLHYLRVFFLFFKDSIYQLSTASPIFIPIATGGQKKKKMLQVTYFQENCKSQFLTCTYWFLVYILHAAVSGQILIKL